MPSLAKYSSSSSTSSKSKKMRTKTITWAEDLVQFQEHPSLSESLSSSSTLFGSSFSAASALSKESKRQAPPRMKAGLPSSNSSNLTVAAKIAIGMGITGPSASKLIPDFILTRDGFREMTVPGNGVRKLIPPPAAATVPAPALQNAQAKGGSKIPVPARTAGVGATLVASAVRVQKKGMEKSTSMSTSKIALAMGVNGTPASKSKVVFKGKGSG